MSAIDPNELDYAIIWLTPTANCLHNYDLKDTGPFYITKDSTLELHQKLVIDPPQASKMVTVTGGYEPNVYKKPEDPSKAYVRTYTINTDHIVYVKWGLGTDTWSD